MLIQKRILLVEGQDDRVFFQEFLCQLKLEVAVEPETPRRFCATESDGVDVIRTQALPMAWNRIQTGDITHLGIVIDADSQDHNNGFSKRREQLTNILQNDYGYEVPSFSNNELEGEIFTHPEKYTAIGLWIMPTHGKDGMFEDLLLENLANETQETLLERVDDSIDTLAENRLFKDTHLSKARLSTLLAWQKKPGLATDKAYKSGIFDREANALVSLTQWLNNVFNEKNE